MNEFEANSPFKDNPVVNKETKINTYPFSYDLHAYTPFQDFIEEVESGNNSTIIGETDFENEDQDSSSNNIENLEHIHFENESAPNNYDSETTDEEIIDSQTEESNEIESLMLEMNALVEGETVKVGDVSFTTADVIASSEDYKDPSNSGNLLLTINPSERKAHISANFLTGEFVRAQGGKHTWNYARLDPLLIDNVQRLRSFIGRGIDIVDGYYPPKYLSQVLGIKDSDAISGNPHISGRGAKIFVKSYADRQLDIAIAAILACDEDIRISIGDTNLSIYVKQLADPLKRFTSFIKDEKIKVSSYKFCFNFSSLVSPKVFASYGQKMQRATANLIKLILLKYYKMVPDVVWPDEIGDIISLMHKQIEDPEVILYALAYSPFGNLARLYLKDKSANKEEAVRVLKSACVRPDEIGKASIPNTFYYLLNQFDKTGFIKLCYDRYDAVVPKEKAYHIVKKHFFDWKYNSGDKIFYQQMKEIIKKVYKINGYKYSETIQQLPEGGTRRNLVLSDPKPDRPTVDFTGRYFIEFPSDPAVSGSYLLINQSGNYIAGKFGSVHKKAYRAIKLNLTNKQPKNLRDTVMEFFGKVNEQGEGICDLPPQMSIRLKKLQDQVLFTIKNNVTGKDLGSWTFSLRSPDPIISNSMMSFIMNRHHDKEDLFVALAWAQPLPSQMKKFNEFLPVTEKEVEKAIVQYYNIDEDMQSVRTTKQGKAIREVETSYRYVYLPNYDQYINYATRFHFSKAQPWRPRTDREFMSKYDWIKRMLEDFRGIKGTKNLELFKRMYNDFDVDTEIPSIEYSYEVNLKTSTTGFGPFAKISGTIIIENKTDYNKYPNAEKWRAPDNKVEYPIEFWNITLSLSKWFPRISSKWDARAEGKSKIAYKETDFSGSNMNMVEWTAFDVSLGVKTGDKKVGVSAGLTKRFLYIVPPGKKELHLEGTDIPTLPDTLTVEPADKNDKSGFDISTPSVSFFRGEINTKKISTDISSVPLPERFEATYKLQSTRYFKHDDATLSMAAIEAVGRMCAEELASLSDPQSKLEIIGHTDASGDPKYNLALSAARAANTLQAVEDRLGSKLKAKIEKVAGLGEKEANQKFGQLTQKNAWLRKVVIIINGRAVLSLGQL